MSSAVCACAHIDAAPFAKDLCNIRLSQTIKFSDLSVRTYTDTHGSYLLIDACPEHSVSVDFSKSDLYTDRYKDLLKQMLISANRGGYPIKMRISGTYSGSDGKDVPATVVVDKILAYQ